MTLLFLIYALLIPFLSIADEPLSSAKKLCVFVSILPQAYFAERVGGDRVDVNVLVGPGHSPATYEPTPRQMVKLSQANVYFRTGVPFENRLMKKITGTFPGLNVADLRQGLKMLHLGSHGEHEHTQDPHIWLDPKRAKIQAQTIGDELCRLDPDRAAQFKKNLAGLLADLTALDAEISQLLAPFRGRSFMVFHPAYGYFADSYGLAQVALEEHGHSPGPRRIAAWIDQARQQNVKVIFVQPQFSDTAVQTIAADIDGVVVPIDPLAHDYLNNLRKMAREIAQAMD